MREARLLLGIKPGRATGREVKEELMKRETFTFGVKALDELTRGGIMMQELIEFAGEFGTGKTQLCHQLSVTVQLPPAKGGVAGSVAYIDTEGTFSPERIEKIGERFGVEDALDNVIRYRVTSVQDLEDTVFFLHDDITKYNIRLVIVDSIIYLYRAQFTGLEKLTRRQQRLNYILDLLRRYAVHYNLAVVYTNQVLDKVDLKHTIIKVPTGGNIIAHAATHRFFLMYGPKDTRIMKVLDSYILPKDVAASYKITDRGIEDVE